MKSAELKREVEQGSIFTLTCTNDLSCIASSAILFANVNFTLVRT